MFSASSLTAGTERHSRVLFLEDIRCDHAMQVVGVVIRDTTFWFIFWVFNACVCEKW